MPRDVETSARSVGKKAGDVGRNGVFAGCGDGLGLYHSRIDQIDVEQVGVRKPDDADMRADRWRVAMPNERDRDVSPVVSLDKKPVAMPNCGDNSFDPAQVRCDDDCRIHVGHVFKGRRVARFVVSGAQGFYFCRSGDVDGVSAEEPAAALVEHERSRDAHFCAEEPVQVARRQVRRGDGGVERYASAPEDEVVEARVDLVVEGVDDDAARANRLVRQLVAVSGIEVAQIHVYGRRRRGVA